MTATGGREAPHIAVAIPAHDSAATLASQLAMVLAQQGAPPFEVVVADDGSRDGTADVVRDAARRDPRVRLVGVCGPGGPSRARNTAVRGTRAQMVACCDADDVVADGWLAAMARALRAHPFVGGVLAVDRLNDPVVVAARGTAVPGQLGDFHGIAFAHGCNLGIRRDVFESVGGFDERLHTGEEIDLALRLAARGVHVHAAADAVVHYRYRCGAKELRRQAFAHAQVVPRLARTMRTAGLGRPSRLGGARTWAWLLRNAGRGDAAQRLRWQWMLASSCGRLAGSFRARTLYL